MTPDTTDQVARLAQQREDLATQRRRIEQAYALAVLDHMAATVRQMCPEAAYVTFAYYGKTRALDLHGALGAAASQISPLPWLWDACDSGGEHPLDHYSDKLEVDLQQALEPYDSPAWATVSRNAAAEGNSWLLELPPADRAVHIADLIRQYHPEATAVVVDRRNAGGRVIEIIEGIAEDGTDQRTTRRRWSRECDDTIAALVAQIFALPTLADKHLVPAGSAYRHPYGSSPSDLVCLMPLPSA
ncbi:hypothetical protein [Streptantibioticus ferralitis]|uniref:Uncharacterized protein n=1 Tax=Streptantibioticus ferralitis TaxID=236510 RepID=A0ABT5Z0F7_9ACTN|nr:hypothetical protein [Streptantibioticus ferralitis]MDF2257162.1 hypothetical protein [Streptantibioticus ferralitis]